MFSCGLAKVLPSRFMMAFQAKPLQYNRQKALRTKALENGN